VVHAEAHRRTVADHFHRRRAPALGRRRRLRQVLRQDDARQFLRLDAGQVGDQGIDERVLSWLMTERVMEPLFI